MTSTSYIGGPKIKIKVDALLASGRKEITTYKELRKYERGSLISYINKNKKFRPGGFITKITKDYFIYITPSFDQRYRMRFENVDKMYVGDVYKVRNDVISFSKTSQIHSTPFPIEVKGVIVFYARNSFEAKRYVYSKKYVCLMKWIEYFCPDN